jgi:hypothetical protein
MNVKGQVGTPETSTAADGTKPGQRQKKFLGKPSRAGAEKLKASAAITLETRG